MYTMSTRKRLEYTFIELIKYPERIRRLSVLQKRRWAPLFLESADYLRQRGQEGLYHQVRHLSLLLSGDDVGIPPPPLEERVSTWNEVLNNDRGGLETMIQEYIRKNKRVRTRKSLKK